MDLPNNNESKWNWNIFITRLKQLKYSCFFKLIWVTTLFSLLVYAIILHRAKMILQEKMMAKNYTYFDLYKFMNDLTFFRENIHKNETVIL